MIKNDKCFITGHKNPDTDSICAAVGYAYLKNKIDYSKEYISSRAGHINEETKFVLNYFNIPQPQLITDVRPQVSDIDIKRVKAVKSDISLKTAWNVMREEKIVTLPVINNDDSLVGVITIGDITKSYMEEADATILGEAKTPFKNLVHTLDATVLVDYKSEFITEGKILVAAANPDIMETYFKPNDIVIVGNRYETQLCAIEMGCSCIIVSYNSPVSITIQKLAKENNCAVLTSPYDTFTIARIINQSIPISYFMTSDDIICFNKESYIEDILTVMTKKKFREFPIMDKDKYVGLISRRNLLEVHKKKVIMVDHNEMGQAVDGIDKSDVLEIIDHHKIATLETAYPIYFRNQPLGCTSTIVYLMYKENGVDIPKHIAGGLCSAIISDTLLFRSPTCTEIDKNACIELAKIADINIEEYAQAMFKAGSDLEDKTAEEIFLQDFKKFSVGSTYIGVGQINIMGKDVVASVREKLIPYLELSLEREKLDIIYFMLTDIFEETTYMIYVGNSAKNVLSVAFKNAIFDGETAVLKNVVSRKKQVVPSLISAINELEEDEKK